VASDAPFAGLFYSAGRGLVVVIFVCDILRFTFGGAVAAFRRLASIGLGGVGRNSRGAKHAVEVGYDERGEAQKLDQRLEPKAERTADLENSEIGRLQPRGGARDHPR